MKKRLLTLMLLMCMSSSLMAKDKKIAFLIGVSNVAPILNTDKDIETIKSLLAHDYDEIIELQDDNASYTKLRSTFEKLYALDASDTLFFYYTGHGSRFYHGSKEDKALDEFLVLSSMQRSGNEVSGGVMIDDELNYHFSQIKAKKIIIFDCCHSETMKKGMGRVKSWRPKGGAIVHRRFDIDPKHTRAINSNYINLSASLKEEQSEDSRNGGVFTLTLQKVLKERGDISFSELITGIQNNLLLVARQNGTVGDFIPNMSSDHLNPKSFRTKDIFAVRTEPNSTRVKESLEDYLSSKLGGVELKIDGKKQKEYSIGEGIQFSTQLQQQKGNIYLLEVKNEQYKLVAKQQVERCKDNNSQKQCVFRNLASLPPLGDTHVYLIFTKHPLDISKSHTKALSESLKNQLKNQAFEVGMVSFRTTQ